MQRICAQPWCQEPFEVTVADRALMERLTPMIAGKKYPLPEPTLCPRCRSQRRLSHRNERTLYKRTCDLTKKPIISIYPEEAPFPVYEPEAWHSDRWDDLASGIPFSFDIPFFDQWRKVQQVSPRIALAVVQNENCPYVNQMWQSRNCHLCIDGGFSEDALYCYGIYHSKDAVDCTFTRNTELSYDLVDCTGCSRSISLLDCKDCHDSFYSIDCAQCHCVAFCRNLRGRQYCIDNVQVTKEEWEKLQAKLQSGSWKQRTQDLQHFAMVRNETLRRSNHNIQCDDCTGDYLLHARNCHVCFDGEKSQDLRYCTRIDERLTTGMDIDHASFAEIGYESLSICGHSIFFTHGSWSMSNSRLFYCDVAFNSSDCFGCAGIKNRRYCILNKQYSKEEYEMLVPKIIAHMQQTGEWGEFFPEVLSPFCYNESAAHQYEPLTKEEVRTRGWRWREETEEVPKVARTVTASDLPDSLADIPDTILEWAVICETTKRPFRIIKQELDFYRKLKLPIPRLHPDERHRRRLALRNPRHLWKRTCGKCQKPIETTYAPDRPERVYCENCYLKEVY